MSTFKKYGEWHDLGHDHKFLLVESSYAEKVVGGVLKHNMRGTDQPCEPGLVAWEQPGGAVRPLFRVVSPREGKLTLEPHIICEVCGDKGWIRNGEWVPKVDVSEGAEPVDPIPSVPLEGEGEMFTAQVRRDLGDIVPEEEENADRKLYALDGTGDVVPEWVEEEDEPVGDQEKIDTLLQEGKESELLSVDESAKAIRNMGRKDLAGTIEEIVSLGEADEHVNHPAHYGGDTTYEAIKVIEAWELGFCLGNTVKYIARAGRKPGISDNGLRDLRKARWYLDREISKMEGKFDE